MPPPITTSYNVSAPALSLTVDILLTVGCQRDILAGRQAACLTPAGCCRPSCAMHAEYAASSDERAFIQQVKDGQVDLAGDVLANDLAVLRLAYASSATTAILGSPDNVLTDQQKFKVS